MIIANPSNLNAASMHIRVQIQTADEESCELTREASQGYAKLRASIPQLSGFDPPAVPQPRKVI